MIDFRTNETTNLRLYLCIQNLKQTALQSGRVLKKSYLNVGFGAESQGRIESQLGIGELGLRVEPGLDEPRNCGLSSSC